MESGAGAAARAALDEFRAKSLDALVSAIDECVRVRSRGGA